MKLKTSIILTTLVGLVATPAVANPVWDLYAGLAVGVGAETLFIDGKTENQSAQSFGAMFGVDIPAFRIEAEYNYLKQSDAHANLALANVYFKVPSTVVKPYIGVGAGVMFSGENEESNKSFDTTGAYQAMLGLTVETPALPFKFDIEARAVYAPDVYEIADKKPDFLHYEGRLKLRYIF